METGRDGTDEPTAEEISAAVERVLQDYGGRTLMTILRYPWLFHLLRQRALDQLRLAEVAYDSAIPFALHFGVDSSKTKTGDRISVYAQIPPTAREARAL